MVNNRRSELEIMGKLIELSKEGARKTDLLYKGNLSYSQLQGYLRFLLDKDIVEERIVKSNGNNGKYYYTTDKGFEVLRDVRKVLDHFGY